MSKTVPVVATVVVVVLAGVVYTTVFQSSTQPNQSASIESAAKESTDSDSSRSVSVNSSSTVSLTNAESTRDEKPRADGLASSAGDNTEQANNSASATGDALNFAQTIGREYVNDETLLQNAEKLRNDPALLASVIDEFLAETDQERLDRLRLLLGQLDDPLLVGAAEAMVFSGNAVSADAGLDLLRDISADVPAARTVALDVLSSTQDPELLVGATNVMASKGSQDAEIAQQVVSSMSSLVQHPDARVRRASYSMLARWSNDPSVTPTLLQGLTDDDPAVRRSTAYGLVGYKHADATVVDALLSTAEKTSDSRRGRRAAVRALQGMSLNESQSARFEAVQNTLN